MNILEMVGVKLIRQQALGALNEVLTRFDSINKQHSINGMDDALESALDPTLFKAFKDATTALIASCKPVPVTKNVDETFKVHAPGTITHSFGLGIESKG